MKAANKQVGIRLLNIQELTLVATPERKLRRWRVKVYRTLLEIAKALLRAPQLERAVAPGQPALDEHEFRPVRMSRMDINA